MLISMNIGAYYEYLNLKVKIFLELLEKKCNLIYNLKIKGVYYEKFYNYIEFFSLLKPCRRRSYGQEKNHEG